jgi:hypothetical protein
MPLLTEHIVFLLLGLLLGELFMLDHWKPYVAFERSKITFKS